MRGWAEADAAGWKEPREPLVQASLGLSTVTAGRDSLRGGGSQFLDWTHIAGAGGASTWGSTIVCQLKEYLSWLKGSMVETRWGF